MNTSAMNVVLLAEDESVSRRFLEDAVEALGHRCESVLDGAQALDAACSRRFDLLLLDVNLPELSGPDVLRRLREQPRAASAKTPAIALTADHEIDTRHRLLDAGFVEVGTKPIDVLALERLIARALGPVGHSIEAPVQASHWDDATALRAVGGRHEIVQALRGLMRQELPKQRQSIVAAIQFGRYDEARAELHRLRASCGFCGALQLSQATEALQAALQVRAPSESTLTQFLDALDQLLIAE